MKKEILVTALATYDTKKGYGRSVKEEPHIAELRKFVKNLPDAEELTDDELCSLANILLDKPTRNDSESAKLFKDLTQEFGGFEALDCIKGRDAVTGATVKALQKIHFPLQLAELIQSLPVSVPVNTIDTLMPCLFQLNKVYQQDHFLASFHENIEKISNDKILLLSYLNQQGIYTDDILPGLIEAGDVTHFHSILMNLQSATPSLISLERITALLKIENTFYLNLALDSLPKNALIVDCLIQHHATLSKLYSPHKLFKAFAETHFKADQLSKILTYLASEENVPNALGALKDGEILKKDFAKRITKLEKKIAFIAANTPTPQLFKPAPRPEEAGASQQVAGLFD